MRERRTLIIERKTGRCQKIISIEIIPHVSRCRIRTEGSTDKVSPVCKADLTDRVRDVPHPTGRV